MSIRYGAFLYWNNSWSERERERERETESEAETEREGARERERERERERKTEKEQKERQTERESERVRQRQRQREREGEERGRGERPNVMTRVRLQPLGPQNHYPSRDLELSFNLGCIGLGTCRANILSPKYKLRRQGHSL